jgi:hypothetical protein
MAKFSNFRKTYSLLVVAANSKLYSELYYLIAC